MSKTNREVVVTGAIPQRNKHAEAQSHINPATRFSKYNTRNIDTMDPDDWWGTTTTTTTTRTAQPRASDTYQQYTAETTFHHQHGEFETTTSGGPRRYYYHEYHYIHYTSQRMGSSKRSSRMNSKAVPLGGGGGGRGGLEAARLAFAKAQSSMDSSTIAHQIHEVASHCNSDVVTFALAIGALSSQDCSTVSRKGIEKKARRCIAMAFHPDRVHHADDDDVMRRVAILGHCILQEMNGMGGCVVN